MLAGRPAVEDEAVAGGLPSVKPGGFDEGHLGSGNRESVDEDLGDKPRLEVDLDDGLSKGRRRPGRGLSASTTSGSLDGSPPPPKAIARATAAIATNPKPA